VRLARPNDWARDYWIPFDRFRRLDRVRIIEGTLTGVELAGRAVSGNDGDGAEFVEEYDALVISTGVSNGFWRRPTLQSAADVGADLHAAHDRLATAASVIVVGGGAAVVTSAVNLATTWPDKRIDLYFPGDRALGGYHPRIWQRIQRRLTALGVGVHPGHRAALTNGFAGEETTGGRRLEYRTGGGFRRCGAVGDRAGATQHRLAAARVARRQRIRSRHIRAAGGRSTGGVRGRRHGGHRSAAQLGSQSRRRANRAQRARRRRPGTYRAPGRRWARSWASSPTGWRSSCPPARRSVCRHGRLNGW